MDVLLHMPAQLPHPHLMKTIERITLHQRGD